MKRYFEFVGADSSRASGQAEKFWEISVSKSEITVRFGKIGANGQSTLKSFPDASAALREAEKLIAEKIRKGYVESKGSKTSNSVAKPPATKAQNDTKECVACAEAILSAAMLCKHCGTLQSDPRFAVSTSNSNGQAAGHQCLACGNAVEPHQRICGSCDATKQAPKKCPSCHGEIKSEKLKKGVVSAIAGRIRKCPSCGYYFFLPPGLAEVMHTNIASELSQVDIEYLFFGAWDYQMQAFGGSVPSIECDFDVAQPIYDNWLDNDGPDDFSSSWAAAYFPVVKQGVLFEVLKKYQSDPQLFSVNFNIDADDEVFDLEIYSYLSLPELESPELRVALVKSLKISAAIADKSLINATNKFLNSIDVFHDY
jgi:predicted DNA-binding WGR domain protein